MLEILAQWVKENESLLSGGAAIIAILSLTYGGLRQIFSPILRRPAIAERKAVDSAAFDKPSAPTGVPAGQPQRGSRARAIYDDHVSLVVLRFESLSRNEDDQFLASGIASEVISLVTPVPDIRVSSRNSTFQLGSAEADVQQAAEQLNANFALSGCLQRAQDRIRVIARLTDVITDTEIWTHTYDRKVADLFDVQNDIARSIVGAMLGQVRLAETLLAKRTPDQQLDAWGLLQKAYHFWLSNFSVEGMMQAMQYLRRAIELDPDYPAPRAALAMLLAQQMTTRVCENYDAVVAEASDMIEKAYRLAPNDIEVLENAGVVWQNLGESDRAIKALRHGIELAPLNLISRGYLAMTLAFTRGEPGAREGKELLEENFAIAPKHPSVAYWRFFMAVAEQGLGNYEESVKLCVKSLQGQPMWVHNYYLMANARCVLGDVQAARRDLAAATSINPFLTPSLYLDNVNRITGSAAASAPFVDGLLRAELIQAPATSYVTA